MGPCLTAPVRSGAYRGWCYWSIEVAAFGAVLEAADPDLWQLERSLAGPGEDPARGFGGGGRVPVGGALGRCLTVDGLLDRLDLRGLRLDPASVEAASGLGDRVARVFGEVELIGQAGDRGWELDLLRPDGHLIPLPPPDGTSVAAVARALLDRCWSGRWGPAEEQAAELLALGYLSEVDHPFSVTAASICEWFLFDGQPVTGLERGRLEQLLRAARARTG